jgi:fumarate reductase subunit D
MLSMNTAWGENPALSYRNLRAITGYVGLTLPVVLLLAGAADGHIESSISAYYYSRVGNVFTGALCVIGVFLLAYRLTAWAIDNLATTVAGISALGVAFFHAAPPNPTPTQLRLADVHLTCAAVLFIVLGAISLFIFPRDVLPPQRWRANWYRAFGALIWLSIILMPVLSLLAGSFYPDGHVFFILETVCVMAFAVSFILKGHGQPGDPRLDRAAGRPPYTAARPPAAKADDNAPRQPAARS